ncbi:MAG: hypothetical protein ACYST0_00555, partial [Planctomycetota bacterium]
MNPDEAKNRSRGISTDMSSDAIAHRLSIASELFRLAKTLQGAKLVGPVKSTAQRADFVAEGPSNRGDA